MGVLTLRKSYKRRIASRAAAVFRKFGSDAHLWLPGLGSVNGIQARNYLDGALAATSIGGSVGHVLDAGGGSITASNATATQKFTLNQTGGRYRWSLDGVDDRIALSSLPFTVSDDYTIIVSANISTTGIADVFAVGSTASANPLIIVGSDNNNFARFLCRDDASVTASLFDSSMDIRNKNTVIAGRKTGNTRSLWRDGVKRTEATTALGASTFGSALIGARPIPGGIGQPSAGGIFGIIAIKGSVSDTDVQALSVFLAV